MGLGGFGLGLVFDHCLARLEMGLSGFGVVWVGLTTLRRGLDWFGVCLGGLVLGVWWVWGGFGLGLGWVWVGKA